MGDKVIDFKQYGEDKIMNNAAGKMGYQYDKNIVNVMTFEEWSEINDVMERRSRQKRKVARRVRANYYRRQRTFGGLIISFGTVTGTISYFTDIPALGVIGVCMALAGLYTLFTKQMILVDEYFLEQQDKLYR